MRNMTLPVGKLPSAALERLLRLCREDPRVVVRAGIAQKAGVSALTGVE